MMLQRRGLLLPAPALPAATTARPPLATRPPPFVCRLAAARCAAARCAAAATATTLSRAAVGIDLGTTNSVVAVLREGEAAPTVLHDPAAGGAFTVPSVVAYDAATGQQLVGAAAKAQAASNPANTFYSVKRLLGRQPGELAQLRLLYDTAAAAGDGGGSGGHSSSSGGVQLVCPALGKQLAPEEVTAELLRHLLQLAGRHLGAAAPQQVVITVPAYFSNAQRAATLAAARLAGVAQASLLQEPVAAALAFGYGKRFDADTLLVFDLGGGTFDLSVVDSFEGISEVLATGGDAALGGDDWDQALLAWLLEQQPQQHAADSSSSQGPAAGAAAARAQLLAAVEAAKCALSGHDESVRISVPGQQQQGVELTRQHMHAVTASLRQRLWQPLQPLADACKLEYVCAPAHIEQRLAGGRQPPDSSSSSSSNGSSAAAAAGAAAAAADPYAPGPRRLTAVLLVGGATRMPLIQSGLRVLTGLEPRREVDPEQAVALGAAIQAAVLLGLSSGVELMDGSYVEEAHSRSTGFA